MDIVAKDLHQMLRKIYQAIRYSFPLQLLLHQLRRNQFFVLMWLIMLGFVSENIGQTVGAPYLLLDPEYCNQISFSSLFVMGLSVAMFTMAFHISGYILHGQNFMFLASVRRPLVKYYLNNSLIPLSFLVYYLHKFIDFQVNNGLQPTAQIFKQVGGFLLGYGLVHLITLLYFSFTYTDIFQFVARRVDKQLRKNKIYRVNVIKRLENVQPANYRVDWYFETPISIVAPQDISHHEQLLIGKVFNQNHLKAFILELMAISLLLALGALRDNTFVQIPAAASTFLLLSLIMMFAGALAYWLREWAATTFLLLIILLNLLVSNGVISPDYKAFGLDYNTQTSYNLERVRALASDSLYRVDLDSTQAIMNRWRAKFDTSSRPKMVFICTSGGGQRAAAWTVRVLQCADSVTNGQVFKNAMLITGASGGMIGAAYMRELYYRSLKDSSLHLQNPAYFRNITKDMLNPIIFSLVVNDMFLRLQRFQDGKYFYEKDRGYAFEQQFHRNTDYVLNKRLRDYIEPERTAKIPMLVLSPTIINDGRKLYISAQYVSYLSKIRMQYSNELVTQRQKGVDFRRLFAQQNADNLQFVSALRMSATFPYITPNITMPSRPAIEIMDAGLTDNYGVSDALRFIYTFRGWIKKNTGGVVLLIIRDSGKEVEMDMSAKRSGFDRLFNPIGSVYSNWATLQDNNNDVQIEFVQGLFPQKMQVLNFQYVPRNYRDSSATVRAQVADTTLNSHLHEERASLSWHLTALEKKSLYNTIQQPVNQESLKRLEELFATHSAK